MDTIKCGRDTYELRNGDIVLDNGACLQLITRKLWSRGSPRVSKKEMKKYTNLPSVVKIPKNCEYTNSIMYEYTYIKND